ncbi:MAG: hypothetical protein WCF59_14075, partial [Desulfobaccales bacterium]
LPASLAAPGKDPRRPLEAFLPPSKLFFSLENNLPSYDSDHTSFSVYSLSLLPEKGLRRSDLNLTAQP